MFGSGENRSVYTVDSHGCSVRARTEVLVRWMPLGVRFGNNRVVCAEGRSSVRERTEVCARKDGYSLDENVLCYVRMIRVYWA